jgi:hypothetical protein
MSPTSSVAHSLGFLVVLSSEEVRCSAELVVLKTFVSAVLIVLVLSNFLNDFLSSLQFTVVIHVVVVVLVSPTSSVAHSLGFLVVLSSEEVRCSAELVVLKTFVSAVLIVLVLSNFLNDFLSSLQFTVVIHVVVVVLVSPTSSVAHSLGFLVVLSSEEVRCSAELVVLKTFVSAVLIVLVLSNFLNDFLSSLQFTVVIHVVVVVLVSPTSSVAHSLGFLVVLSSEEVRCSAELVVLKTFVSAVLIVLVLSNFLNDFLSSLQFTVVIHVVVVVLVSPTSSVAHSLGGVVVLSLVPVGCSAESVVLNTSVTAVLIVLF